jgi:hypothetical protein
VSVARWRGGWRRLVGVVGRLRAQHLERQPTAWGVHMSRRPRVRRSLLGQPRQPPVRVTAWTVCEDGLEALCAEREFATATCNLDRFAATFKGTFG